MTQDRLLAQIASILGTEPCEVGEDSNFETLATWDSQREVELALMLEREYAIELSDDEIARLRSVVEIRAVLTAHGVSA